MSRLARHLLVLLLLLSGATAIGAGIVDFSPGLLKFISGKWGEDAVERVQNWRKKELEGLAIRAENKSESPSQLTLDELRFFNRFWNRIPYVLDKKNWGADDYWATPVEALGTNGADCEDYSIAKYFSLKELGVPPESLRITYVYSVSTNEAHMVLAYYPTPDAEPYILDNMTGKLLPASERDDLEPVYSFNDDDMWTAGVSGAKGKSSQIRLWNDLQGKMEKERRM